MDAEMDDVMETDDNFDENSTKFNTDSSEVTNFDDKLSDSIDIEKINKEIYTFKTEFPDLTSCHYCHATFNSRLETKRHMLNQHGRETMYKCKQCSYKVKEKLRLLKHVNFVHKEIKSNEVNNKVKGRRGRPPLGSYIKCRFCFMEFTKVSMQNHLSSFHRINYKPYSCVYCQFKTNQALDLIKHINVHEHLKTFSCSFCDYKAFKLPYLKRHVAKRHRKEMADKSEDEVIEEVQKDDKIDKKFKDKESSDDGMYPCDQCSFIAVSRQYYSRHLIQCHQEKFWTVNKLDIKTELKNEDEKTEPIKEIETINKDRNNKQIKDTAKFYCTKCDFVTLYESLYNEHAACAHSKPVEIKPQVWYNCEYCSFTTVYPHSVKRHYEFVHFKINKKPEVVKAYQCDYCKVIFDKKIKIRRHVEQDHDYEKPFNCSKCDYKAAVPDLLSKHMRLHM